MNVTGRDLRSQAATLRRRVRVLVTAAVLGLAAGATYVVTEPTPMTSTSLVLLPTPALAESSSSDVATQVRIALSAGNLQQAGAALDPDLDARQVESMVKVTAATDQLLQVEATSPQAAQAQVLSQAVADTYVNYVRNTGREVTAATLADLSNRRNDLQTQLDQLNKELAASKQRQRQVDANSREGQAEAQLHGGLVAQQAIIVQQLEKVRDKIAAGTPAGSSATGTSVVQPATVAEGPSLALRLLIWAPAGAMAALLLAGAVVLVAERRDRRVRMRDDIADAISSPVLASIRSRPQRSAAGWSALLESYRATPVEAWALRQVLRGLAPGKSQLRVAGKVEHPQSVTVVSLAGDDDGLAVGPQLAAFAASLGIATWLVPTVGHDRAPTLWACAAEHTAAPIRPNLHVSGTAGSARVELTVQVVVVERMLPFLGDTPASDATLLSVAAGAATEQELARVAVAVDDTGRRIDGIVVANPDPADRTTGRHTIAERSHWPALPTRLTGVGSTTGPAAELQRSRS